MIENDYTIYYKDIVSSESISSTKYDVFISAYNSSQRVKDIFSKVTAKEKIWLIFPEYSYDQNDYPKTGKIIDSNDTCNETQIISQLKPHLNKKLKVCIDITGFIRPHLIYLIAYLNNIGIKILDTIYSEPLAYSNHENTKFSKSITETRVVKTCGGSPNIIDTNDILIFSPGYDTKLISQVLSYKKSCVKKIQLLGFPSLQPDMYQENVLNSWKVLDSENENLDTYYAPANDPFVTAQVLQEICKKNDGFSNLYLSPLSTKPQVLGYIIYYLWECKNKNVNIIFPFAEKYDQMTSQGRTKTWLYTIELPGY